MKRRIPLDSQTKEEEIDTSATKTTQEQIVHIAGRILIFYLINQHLIRVHHQALDLLFPSFYPNSCHLNSTSLSSPTSYIFVLMKNTGPGNDDNVANGKKVP